MSDERELGALRAYQGQLERHLDDMRISLATALRERDEARADLAAEEAEMTGVHDCIQTVADEAFGPFPIETAGTLLSHIERGIFDLRRSAIEAITERDRLLSVLGEGSVEVVARRAFDEPVTEVELRAVREMLKLLRKMAAELS